MNSKSKLVYALAAVASLALGLGISFWRAAAESNELVIANHGAEMALEAAQDETKALRDKLQREGKAREYAEAAQAISEHLEHAAREKLAQETKAHRDAEAAQVKIAAELQAATKDLATTENALRASEKARTEAESTLQTASAQLTQAEEARHNMEAGWQLIEYKIMTVTAQLNDEISARKMAEAALARAKNQVRKPGARLRQSNKVAGGRRVKAAPNAAAVAIQKRVASRAAGGSSQPGRE